MAKFCANLNFLFKEKNLDLAKRIALAKSAGFRAVEIGIPDQLTIQEASQLVEQINGVNVVLMNIYLGAHQHSGVDFGCAAIPSKIAFFRENLLKTVEFAKIFNCQKIHLMAGQIDGPPTKEHHDTYMENMIYATDILEKNNLIGVIEPISSYGVPRYYLNNYDMAVDIIEKAKSKHLKLMVDLFHLQHIKGNITSTFKDLKNYIGHVQIAQVPGRNEPSEEGEINYKYVFKVIQESGYNDWIGCEYKPKSDTNKGLSWIKEFGYSL